MKDLIKTLAPETDTGPWCPPLFHAALRPDTLAQRLLASWIALCAGLLLFGFSTSIARADQNPPGCNGSGLGINLFTSTPDVHIGDTISYSVTVFNGLLGTGRTVCDATDIHAFIVTPDGVSHSITLTRTTLTSGQLDYYADVVSYVIRAQDVLPDSTVRATASDTGVIHQNDINSQGGGDQGVNTVVSLPCIGVSVQCTGAVGQAGSIDFTGWVTNCGNNTLVGVTVTNSNDNGNFSVTFPSNLLSGAIVQFSGSFVPLNPCAPSTVTVVATGTDQFTTHPRTLSAIASSTCSTVLTPDIKVTLACPSIPIHPGQSLTFSGTVTNTGDVTLTNVIVLGDHPANTVLLTLATLAPGAGSAFTGSYIAPVDCSTATTVSASGASVCGVLVADHAAITCPILTTPLISVSVACSTNLVAPGGLQTFTGTVSNTGDIPLKNIVVIGDHPAVGTSLLRIALLAPGASTNFSGGYTVPLLDACSVTTTVTASAQDVCTDLPVTASSAITCGVTTTPQIAVTLLCPTTSVAVGAPINYTGTVINTGNVTLTNVTVVDTQSSPNTVLTVASLAPGASAIFTASFTAPSDACSVSTTVVVSGNDKCTSIVVSASKSVTCPLVTTPALVLTQNCPTIPAVPGGRLVYTGTVRNSGNVTLTNIVINNSLSGNTPIFTAASLAPGTVANFSGSYLAPTNCSTTSVSTATATSICGVAVTGSVTTTCTILTSPGILVAVACPTNAVFPGGSIAYAGTVKNTGNITLTNVIVVSDLPTPNTTLFTVPLLPPGSSTNFIGTYLVPTNTCSVTASFQATGADICTLDVVTNLATTTCTVTTAPQIAVTLACPVITATVGQLITYTGTVSNVGNVTLDNVTVVDTQASPATVLAVVSLAPGATTNFLVSFLAPSDACSVTTTVGVSGSDNCTSLVVSASQSVTCPLLSSPKLLLTQNCPTIPAVPGGKLTFTGTVQNSGNITLTNVSIVNNLSGVQPIFTAATLAPGATASFSGSYLAPTNCSSTSTSTATGTSICGIPVTTSATSTCDILTTPALTVTQSCPPEASAQGANLTFTGTVKNTGNISLTNVTVVNSRTGLKPLLVVAVMAPGDSTNFTGTFLVPTNCCTVSSTSTAIGADSCNGVIIYRMATATCQVLSTPQLTVTKICPPQIVNPGDLLKYTGSVSNSGDITLVDVVVINNRSGTNTPVFGPITLAPGESANFKSSYIYQADFCGTDTVTAEGYSICEIPVSASVTTTCEVAPTNPGIAVTKDCPLLNTPRGGLYVSTGTVINTGNVTLVDVFVVNNMPTNNTPVIGPITLAPGASTNYSLSFTAPVDCCEIVDTVTALGNDLCSGITVQARATTACPLLTIPGIAVSEICPPTIIPPGGQFYFDGSVTNTGDVNLTNVLVYSIRSGGITNLVFGPIELAPGESAPFTGNYTVGVGGNPQTDILEATGMDTCQARTVVAKSNCAGVVALTSGLSLRSVTVLNGVAIIVWDTTPGVTGTLQYKTAMSDPTWTTIPGNATTVGTTSTMTDKVGLTPVRFYRIIVGK